MIYRQTWKVYLYFIPIALFILLIYIYPLGNAFTLSFWNKVLTRPGQDRFIGFDNYIRLFTKEPLFLKTLWNGFIFTFLSVVFEYLFGLVIALILSSKFVKMKNASKALLMLPWAVPIAINSMMWRFLLAPNFGFLSQTLHAMGIPGMLQANWFGDINTAMPAVILINVWRSFPFYTITLTAGLSVIPRELYEAAEADGASGWQRFWNITLPGIKNTSAVIIIFHIIWTFSNFDVIYLLTGGGPLNSTDVLPTLLYRQAFSNFNMGYASTMGIFVFIVLMIIAGPLYNRFVMRED
ncbi:MAG: sugar ABC transporter permease [Treponema sp.]|nr:sugar ABC transporter permease [Treponema sp.]